MTTLEWLYSPDGQFYVAMFFLLGGYLSGISTGYGLGLLRGSKAKEAQS